MLKTLTCILALTLLIGYTYFMVLEKKHHSEKYTSEDIYVQYNKKNKLLHYEIEHLRKLNAETNAKLSLMNEKLKVQNNSYELEIKGPREEYEFLRRLIYTNTKEFWYYIISELNELGNLVDDSDGTTDILKIKRMVSEIYRSMLNDISRLADVDRHSGWRQENSKKLSDLIQTRLLVLQNPGNCNEARKLICNYSTLVSPDCGYVCHVHFHLKCLVIAYVTNRTLVVNDGSRDSNSRTSSTADGHSGWESFFLPLSHDNCSVTTTPLDWPGNRNAQVLTLDMSRFINPNNPYYPFEIPEDLAPALKVLHGDPVVWWIGQFLKFVLRPRPSTVHMLEGFEKKLKFHTPIVGVHIAIHDKYESHKLDEYMFHVDEYYKVKEMSGSIDKRRIYLATDEPTLFKEIQLKYPNYDVIGNIEMSMNTQGPESDQNIRHSIIDVHFLSRCDYLVCTFSSDVGRMAYEMMNSLHPDASARFTSLDEVFDYSGEIRRLYITILPHQTNETDEIELKQGDLIVLSKNHWNGFSRGLNLRTTMRGRFPSFKVAPKMVSKNFSSYPEDVK